PLFLQALLFQPPDQSPRSNGGYEEDKDGNKKRAGCELAGCSRRSGPHRSFAVFIMTSVHIVLTVSTCVLRCPAVQYAPHLPQQFSRRNRLGNHVAAVCQRYLLIYGVRRIAAGKNDLDAGMSFPDLINSLLAVHPRHDEVRQD